MNYNKLFSDELKSIHNANTFKYETALEGPQDGKVRVNKKNVIMLAANNYLGMSNNPVVRKGAINGIKKYGYGLASVRFLCGTQTIHLELEKLIAEFIGTEDAILFSSCFAANNAFFASLTNEKIGFDNYRDVIYTDQLNHASIIDGLRLCKQETTDKRIYRHADMKHLQEILKEDKTKNYRFRIIASDGVFSMEGDLAPIDKLVKIAKENNALLFVDDCHALGVCGKTGRGTSEHFNVFGKIDVISGTLGKAIGGALGGFIGGSKDLIAFLRQKSRPYTFSNSIPPAIVGGSIAALKLLKSKPTIVSKLQKNTAYFRKKISDLGFTIIPGIHPVVPVMLGEAEVAQKMSQELLKHGVYVKGLWFPVVPKGEARLRVQISAAHSKKNLDDALKSFKVVGRKLGII
ncbi:MAG: glycine C-acetyltransferase [Ignavibacteria bacterium]|nr:glycine C-acetyltransferase [Bacteroidota bacterium]MSQ45953.1 glycine C-acetyltransferase [Ignavibacteria bacterium]